VTYTEDPNGPGDLRIGASERESAREALEEHRDEERLDAAEFEQRWAACQAARTRAELLQIFVDLPEPHPDLPDRPGPSSGDDDISLLGWTIGLMLVLGLPIAAVFGIVYGAWWALSVPVALSAAFLYTEHLLTRTAKVHKGSEAEDAPGVPGVDHPQDVGGQPDR
jgi:Domain of unknown function (DUF1707)